MDKAYNDLELIEKGLLAKYVIFYQSIKELTDWKTFSIYRYPMMNSISILKELLELIDLANDGALKGLESLFACKDECIAIIMDDISLQNSNKVEYRKLLKILQSAKFDTYVNRNKVSYKIASTIAGIENTYLSNLLKLIGKSIDLNEDKNVMNLSNTLVSYCIYLGYSERALNKYVDTLIENPDWNVFSNNLIECKNTKYNVYFSNSNKETSFYDTNTTEIEKLKELFNISNISHLELASIIEKSNSNLTYKKIDYFCKSVEALDEFNAMKMAFSSLAELMNILSFYNLIYPWDNNFRDVLVENVETHEIKKISVRDLNGLHRYRLSIGLSHFTHILEFSNASRDIMIKKFINSYSYVNMGRYGMVPEDKFINLWVALESLCRNDAYNNIFECILDFVPNALCVKFINLLIHDFIKDCEKTGIVFFNNDDKRDKRVAYCISVLKGEEDGINKLLQACKEVNSKVYYKCSQLHSLLSGPKKDIAKFINDHKKEVARQLNRLHKTRNDIAHTAKIDIKHIIRMSEYLDSYMEEIAYVIILCSSIYPSLSLNELMQRIILSVKSFIDNPEESKTNLSMGYLEI